MHTVTLQALVSSDHEQFIQDNQEAFNYGAMEEFGLRDAHFEEGDQIISRKTIEDAINSGEAYRILFDNAIVGGAVIKVSGSHGDLELLFISPASHSKGIDIDSSLKFYENIGYTQLTDMVSDEWFDSVKSLVAVLDDKRFKGYYKIDVEVEDWSEFSVEMS